MEKVCFNLGIFVPAIFPHASSLEHFVHDPALAESSLHITPWDSQPVPPACIPLTFLLGQYLRFDFVPQRSQFTSSTIFGIDGADGLDGIDGLNNIDGIDVPHVFCSLPLLQVKPHFAIS
jgi:hypothetical protein